MVSTILIKIIYANLIPLLALLALLSMIKSNYLFEKRQEKLFRLMIILNAFMLIFISADAILSVMQLPYAWALRRLTTFINFAASPVIPIFIYKIFSRKKNRLIFYLPAAFNILLCTASVFVKLVFEITENNTYGRGPLFYVPFLISTAYIIVLITGTKRFGRKGVGSERIYLMMFITALCFCMFLEIKEGFFFLSWDCTAIGIILYYLLVTINNSNSDVLTGVYNRAMFNKRIAEIENDIDCTIAVLDVNNFKYINDTFGHDAGDKFLITFANTLHTEMGSQASVFRTGGDEFAVLSQIWCPDVLEQHLTKVRKILKKDNMDFAYGIVLYRSTDNMEQTLIKADQNMYSCKNNIKWKQI